MDGPAYYREGEGWTDRKTGYRHIRREGKIIREHRWVMAQVIGRPLRPFEEPHHKNGLRDDNRPENLELWVHWRRRGQRLEDLLDFIATYYPDEIQDLICQKSGKTTVGV